MLVGLFFYTGNIEVKGKELETLSLSLSLNRVLLESKGCSLKGIKNKYRDRMRVETLEKTAIIRFFCRSGFSVSTQTVCFIYLTFLLIFI